MQLLESDITNLGSEWMLAEYREKDTFEMSESVRPDWLLNLPGIVQNKNVGVLSKN